MIKLKLEYPTNLTVYILIKMSDEKKIDTCLSTPSGTRDFHPHEMALREKILNEIKHVFQKHGAEQIDTPVFEKKEILMGKYGDESKLIYDLDDHGMPLALRYDLTVPFARYVAQHNITNMRKYQVGKVYRRDNPSIAQGRYREFIQFDADFVGNYDSMVPDAEIVSIVGEVLDELSIHNYIIKINHRQLLIDILTLCGVEDKLLKTVCSTIDKMDKLSWEEISKELQEKKVDITTITKIKEYMTVCGKSELIDGLLEKFKDHPSITKSLSELKLLFNYLEAFGLKKVEFDLSLARGLEYYTGMIFEAILLDKTTKIGSVAAGGRYDDLIGTFHLQKRKNPAVGCSIGVERIFTLLEKEVKMKTPKVDVFVCTAGKNMTGEAIKLCRELWIGDIATEFNMDSKMKMKDHNEYVINNKIPYMIVIGGKEIEQSVVDLKDTKTVQRLIIARKDLIAHLQKLLF